MTDLTEFSEDIPVPIGLFSVIRIGEMKVIDGLRVWKGRMYADVVEGFRVVAWDPCELHEFLGALHGTVDVADAAE